MVDVGLIVYLLAWYAGNYYYNIYNKLVAKESGGATFAFTLAFIQLIVGSVYALFLWAAPEARAKPKVRATPPVFAVHRAITLIVLSYWAHKER